MSPIIDQILVYVTDMERSLRFYRDALGFSTKVESPGWSELDAGPLKLALHRASGSGTDDDRLAGGRADLQVRVDDLDAAHRRLLEHGWNAPEPKILGDIGLRVIQTHDPDGLDITLSART